MLTNRRLFLVSAIILSSLTLSQAQQSSTPSAPVVTASGSAEHVRFTAPSNVVRMQLQVFSQDGQVLFDVSSKGNVLDWSLQDSSGQRLFGTYLTVITVKTLSGRVSERIGSVSVVEKQVELQQLDTMRLSVAQQQALGPVEENATLTILKTGEAQAATVVANNGNDGLIIRDHGALSFRLGDFFSAKDTEQMRLTEEGNLGIGTDKPQAKLDVAGVIRTSEGIEFASGTDATGGTKVTKLTTTAAGSLQQTLADGTVVPNATGTGTQNRVAKWADSSGALGDSSLTDTGGNVGLGVTNPGDLLDIAGPPNAAGRSGIHVRTTTTAGNATLYFDNDRGNFSAYGGLLTGGSGNPFLFFGVTRADRTFLIADGPSSLGLGIGTLVSKPVIFGTANAERMRIDSSGNVGVGTTAPGEKLDVTGNINTSTQYNISGNRVLSVSEPNNTFAGVGAGASNTGQQNAFFGKNAGNANTTGIANAIFGSSAGWHNTTGSNNAFFGENAGEDNTTADSNSFFGHHAGQNNTTGGSNSFFGESAGNSNTTGFNNSFFGHGSGSRITTAGNNSFFGYVAGTHNTTGSDNAFFGVNAGTQNTTGSDNAFFGVNAGETHTTGFDNTFIGNGADFSTSNPTGNSDTLLGHFATVNSGVSNGTAIGSNALVTQSNSIVLGSINGTNDATANTKVGIGITAPSSVLHIVSDTEQLITASTNWTGGTWVNFANTDPGGGRVWNLISTGSANSEGPGKLLLRDATGGGNVRMTFDTAGKVGIGTTAPNARFQVAGGDAAVSSQGSGLILKATDGAACYRVTVNNAGILSQTPVTCP
jgi:hypothetical protein